jgi:hypothetical protein
MELLVTYDGKNVMRWFGPNISGSDPVGKLTDEQAVKVAEDIFIGLKLRGVSLDTLNFWIEEELNVAGDFEINTSLTECREDE